MMAPIRILLADEEHLFREILQSNLEHQPNLEVVATASNGPETLQLALECKPDLLILDINLPGLNGIEICQTLLKQDNHIKVLALSMQKDLQSVHDMFRAGAHGYILKTCDFSELLQAIETVQSDHSYLPPLIMEMMLDTLLGKERTSLQQDRELSSEDAIQSLFQEGFNTFYPPPVWS